MAQVAARVNIHRTLSVCYLDRELSVGKCVCTAVKRENNCAELLQHSKTSRLGVVGALLAYSAHFEVESSAAGVKLIDVATARKRGRRARASDDGRQSSISVSVGRVVAELGNNVPIRVDNRTGVVRRVHDIAIPILAHESRRSVLGLDHVAVSLAHGRTVRGRAGVAIVSRKGLSHVHPVLGGVVGMDVRNLVDSRPDSSRGGCRGALTVAADDLHARIGRGTNGIALVADRASSGGGSDLGSPRQVATLSKLDPKATVAKEDLGVGQHTMRSISAKLLS